MPCEHCAHCKKIIAQRASLHAEHLTPPGPGFGYPAHDRIDPYYRVKALLLARGLSAREFADGIVMGETSVSRAFTRCRGFNRHWPVIARFFGVSLDWLLTPAPASLDTARNPDQQSAEAVTSSVAGAASDAEQPSAG